MQLIRNRPGTWRSPAGGIAALTIGNFDGLHRGHQVLIERCRQLAGAQGRVAVVTFEPLPQALFRPASPPGRLTTVHEKLRLLQCLQVDVTWMMRFDLKFSRVPAPEFVGQVIVRGLAGRNVVVGEDFHFGHQREGDVGLLMQLGRKHGFEVGVVPPVFEGGKRVSSSAIRGLLAEGDFDGAATMLGRRFRMEGRVVMGQQLGRKLGYPTANLRVRARPAVIAGIFAVLARVCRNGQWEPWLPAVSSIGRRPTVGGEEPLLEIHFFDFDGDLYGQRLEVQFVAKLRDESRFATIEQLVAQMRRDEAQARDILADTELP